MAITEQELSIIKQEESSLADTYSKLVEQKDQVTSAYSSAHTRSRELTSEIVATRRVEDRVQLYSDEAVSHQLRDMKGDEGKTIDALITRPYFARIILEEELNGQPRKIEYKIGHHANTECRIIDWRKAPLSRLYYEYKEGDTYCEEIQGQEREGTVLLRNTLEANHDKLKSLICKQGSYRFEGDEWISVSGGGSREKTGSSSNQLPSILSLITAEQFKTITENAETAVIIQGIAGSGKTTVALHRLAWLLHSDNSDLKAKDCVVLVRNTSLKTYISQTLPSINVEGVTILTFREWALSRLNLMRSAFSRTALKQIDSEPPASIRRVKGSVALFKRIDQFVTLKMEKSLEEVQRQFPWTELPTGVKITFDTLRSGRKPALGILATLRNFISEGKNKIASTHPKSQGLDKALSILNTLIEQESNFESDLISILSDTSKILELDETKLLDRELITSYKSRLENNLSNSGLESGDETLLLKIATLKKGGLVDEAGKAYRYGHIVIDEAQDFTPVHFSLIIDSVNTPRDLSIVGDTAQSLDGESTFPGWDKLLSHWKLEENSSKFISLKVAHRSTLPIMKLADYVIGENRTESGRAGKPPRWVKCRSLKVALPGIIEWISEVRKRFPTTLSAVITPTQDEAKQALSLLSPTFGNGIRFGDSESMSFDSGIIVADIKSLKGLEFHSVVLWNPSDRFYPDTDLSRRLLYTAITRAEGFLFISTFDTPSKLLPSISSTLVRGDDIP
ncbi:MAG: ATP-binding domain-containing protein [bacterium]|nr:ATP-binding domain-containing protein [bacterium]